MKSLKFYLIVGGVLLTFYIIAQLNKPKSIDWKESFVNKDKIPFGTYVLYNRLKDIFPNSHIKAYRKPVYNAIAEDSISKATYVIICGGIELSKTDYKQLIKYIKQGNDVFIAAGYFGKLLDTTLNIETRFDFKLSDKAIKVNFTNPALTPTKQYTVDKGAGGIYFSKFDTLRSVVLGENVDHGVNFIKEKFGKGALYLSANPKLFSNYSILKPDGAEYAATALSYLQSTKELVWDEYYTQGDEGEDTPMRLFLNNPFLAWAYYIAIFSLLVFVIYQIKRRQRIIPVIEPLSNSTLDFVTVVGQVYYEKRNNVNIAQKKAHYLLEHLREVYQLKTNKLDEEFIERLTAKCGIERSLAVELVNYIKYMNVQVRINDRELIQLNKLIEQFYTQSR